MMATESEVASHVVLEVKPVHSFPGIKTKQQQLRFPSLTTATPHTELYHDDISLRRQSDRQDIKPPTQLNQPTPGSAQWWINSLYNDDGTETEDCRICFLGSEEGQLIKSPCNCVGSSVHYHCLTRWALEKRALSCELCTGQYKEPLRTEFQQLLKEQERALQYPVDVFGWSQVYQSRPGSATAIAVSSSTPSFNHVRAWQLLVIHVVIPFTLVVFFVCLTFVLDIGSSITSKAGLIVWKVCSVGVPVYLVVRIAAALLVWWWVHQQVARRQEQLQQRHWQVGLALRHRTPPQLPAVSSTPVLASSSPAGQNNQMLPAALSL